MTHPRTVCASEPWTRNPKPYMGVRIRGTLRDIDPLNKVPFERATSRVQKGSLLRGPPNTTSDYRTLDPPYTHYTQNPRL